METVPNTVEDTEIARLEAFDRWARANPLRYRRRVIAFAALGYAYLVGITLLAVVGIIAIIVDGTYAERHVFGLVILGFVLWGMLSALRMRLERPKGIRLKQTDAPDLFAAINSVRDALDRPRLDRIMLDSSLNAGVSSRPRLGFLGVSEFTLHIGLIQLVAESRSSFQATLAHELQHIRGGDNGLAHRIYRLRLLWSALASGDAVGGRYLSLLYLPFFRWFAPKFATYTLTLSRNQELAADRVSGEIAGPDAAMHSLLYVALAQGRLDHDFWPTLERTAKTEGVPPEQVFERLVTALHRPYPPETARRYIDQALAWPTLASATHPALTDRLTALGATGSDVAMLPPPIDASALSLLGPEMVADAIDRFSREWASEDTRVQAWNRSRDQHAAELAQLAEYDRVHAQGVLAAGEQRLYERLAFVHRGDEAYVRYILEGESDASPTDPARRLEVAQWLVARRDPRAAGLLDAIALTHPMLRAEALLGLQQYHAATGDLITARAKGGELKRWLDARKQAENERGPFKAGENFLPHGLDRTLVAELVGRLDAHNAVERAWVVRRDLRMLPDLPMFVVGIRTRFDGAGIRAAGRSAALETIRSGLLEGLTFPGETILVVLDNRGTGLYGQLELRGQLELTPDSAIYRRR